MVQKAVEADFLSISKTSQLLGLWVTGHSERNAGGIAVDE